MVIGVDLYCMYGSQMYSYISISSPQEGCTILLVTLVESPLWLLLVFCHKNVGRWEPANGILSFYECKSCGGNTQALPNLCKRILLDIFVSPANFILKSLNILDIAINCS